MNSFGQIFRLTSFGESHGPAVGGVIDGMPAGVEIDLDEVQRQLNRRRPGQSAIVTARDEKDRVIILSGMMDGVTTGAPIGFMVENSNQHSADYDNMRDLFRPSHADFTYTEKYGIRDHRGGGRTSARETISRVVAGAFARQALAKLGIEVHAFTSRVGDISFDADPASVDPALIDSNDVRCPDPMIAEKMRSLIAEVKSQGDTIGGQISGVITGLPAGLGQPVFDKFGASLASAMMGINAAKAFEIGMGMEGCCHRGSEMIDNFVVDPASGKISTATNNSGGIQGGLTNGMPVVFRVGFKPVATLLRDIPTTDRNGNPVTLHAKGRHDPCVLPRAVPVVEAMAAIVTLDAVLLNRSSRL